jgi:hypothetical protein
MSEATKNGETDLLMIHHSDKTQPETARTYH